MVGEIFGSPIPLMSGLLLNSCCMNQEITFQTMRLPLSKTKFTVDDCLMVTGGGTVENDLHFVAAGNVCVNLGEIGNLVAVGSVAGDDDVTTDVIFRNGVTVNGDVEQWNDARVAFEMSAMIEGDVTLDYGDGGVGAYFGGPISDPANFVRGDGFRIRIWRRIQYYRGRPRNEV